MIPRRGSRQLAFYFVIILLCFVFLCPFPRRFSRCSTEFLFDNGTLIPKDFIEETLRCKLATLALDDENETQVALAQMILEECAIDTWFYKLSTAAENEIKPTAVNLFDASAYKQGIQDHPVDEDRCKLITNLKPQFHMCAHNPLDDRWISESIVNGRAWERSVGQLIVKVLRQCSASVLLDLGAGLGSQALYAAAAGFHTWTVDALTMNHVKIYHAAEKSNTSHLVRQVHNIISSEHGEAVIAIEPGNICGTDTGGTNTSPGETETVPSVLLSDVIDHLFNEVHLRTELESITVVLKMDIEHFECRALLGSPNLFHDPRVFIPYVIMEWTFMKRAFTPGMRLYAKECPKHMLKAVTKQFLTGGYHPFEEETGAALNPNISHLWNKANVVWIHKDAPVFF